MATAPRIAASLIVAHPDDEIIFAGNLLLFRPEDEWTIHVLCGHHNDERGRNFIRSIEALQRLGVNIDATVMSNLPDSSSVPREDDWYSIAEDQIAMYHSNADVVFTHNRRGDYGHPLHCVTQYAVEAVHSNVWEFWCPVASGSGPNWEGARSFEAPHRIEKADLLELVYPDEMAAIRRDRPGLWRWAMKGGRETFTSQGTLPW